MNSCRVFVVGLAYSALLFVLSYFIQHIFSSSFIVAFLIYPAIHGVIIAWYSVRDYSRRSWLGYFGALLLGSVIISLWAIIPLAARETDLPVFVPVFMYYTCAVSAYVVAYLVLRRFIRESLSNGGSRPFMEVSQYCGIVVFLIGFAAIYAVIVMSALPVVIGPINVGPPEHAQWLALIYQVTFYGLLAAYTAVVVWATLAAKLSFLEAVEAVLAAFYPIIVVYSGFAIWWSAWEKQVVALPASLLFYALAPITILSVIYVIRGLRKQ